MPDEPLGLTGESYDNSGALGANRWRHVAFIEQERLVAGDDMRWLMSSDVCKHCTEAACLDACPTGAIFRSEFGTVVIQEDVCNGCGYCVVACPFGVIDRRERDGRAFKCTMCYDRLKDGLEPACAKACPTASIQFGPLDELRGRAEVRVRELHARGETQRAALRSRPRRRRGRGGRLLPAARRAGGVRVAARPGGADPAARRRVDGGRARGGRAGRRRGCIVCRRRGDERRRARPRWSRARSRAPTTAGRWSSRPSGAPRCRGTSSRAGSLGGAATLALAAEWRGDERLAWSARVVAMCAGTVSPVLLISDLGRPARFLNMMRVFKPTSPMSVGSWLLAVAATSNALRRRLEGVRAVRAGEPRRRGSRRESPVRR